MDIILEDLKKQINVDYDDDDSLLSLYAKAAQRHVEKKIERSFAEVEESEGDFPDDLYIATLMLAAHFYRVREPVSSIQQARVPYTLDALVTPYRKIL